MKLFYVRMHCMGLSDGPGVKKKETLRVMAKNGSQAKHIARQRKPSRYWRVAKVWARVPAQPAKAAA